MTPEEFNGKCLIMAFLSLIVVILLTIGVCIGTAIGGGETPFGEPIIKWFVLIGVALLLCGFLYFPFCPLLESMYRAGIAIFLIIVGIIFWPLKPPRPSDEVLGQYPNCEWHVDIIYVDSTGERHEWQYFFTGSIQDVKDEISKETKGLIDKGNYIHFTNYKLYFSPIEDKYAHEY